MKETLENNLYIRITGESTLISFKNLKALKKEEKTEIAFKIVENYKNQLKRSLKDFSPQKIFLNEEKWFLFCKEIFSKVKVEEKLKNLLESGKILIKIEYQTFNLGVIQKENSDLLKSEKIIEEIKK